MGDIVKKNSSAPTLDGQLAEREERRKGIHIETRTIDAIAPAPKGKDLSISARVNSAVHKEFKIICERKGISANACLNMLIRDFVRSNSEYL